MNEGPFENCCCCMPAAPDGRSHGVRVGSHACCGLRDAIDRGAHGCADRDASAANASCSLAIGCPAHRESERGHSYGRADCCGYGAGTNIDAPAYGWTDGGAFD